MEGLRNFSPSPRILPFSCRQRKFMLGLCAQLGPNPGSWQGSQLIGKVLCSYFNKTIGQQKRFRNTQNTRNSHGDGTPAMSGRPNPNRGDLAAAEERRERRTRPLMADQTSALGCSWAGTVCLEEARWPGKPQEIYSFCARLVPGCWAGIKFSWAALLSVLN